MKKSIISLSIFLFCSTATLYGMKERVADYNQKKEEHQRELHEILQGVSDEDRKLYEKLNQYNAKQEMELQRAKAEISERKNKQFFRGLWMTAYWGGGIVLLSLGIMLYEAWKKAGVEYPR